jgi:hypothetical protein
MSPFDPAPVGPHSGDRLGEQDDGMPGDPGGKVAQG